MESAGYLRNFRERWLVILLLTIVGVALAFGASRAITPTYSSTATMFLNVESTGASLFERSQFSLQRIKSYPDLVTSPDLLDDVIEELDLPGTRAELAARLSATNPPDTVLLRIIAESERAEEAAAIANAAATRLTTLVDSLENSTDAAEADGIESSIELDLTKPAQEPSSPVSPNTPVILALGLLSGIALGMISAIVLERLRPRVRTVDDIRRAVSLPVVAQLPRSLLKELTPGTSPPKSAKAPLDEAIANIRAIFRGQLPSVLGLAPIDRSRGATAARLAIARSLAATGRRVALIEADRSDQIASFAEDTAGSPGLAEALSFSHGLTDLLIPTGIDSIEILPVGDASTQPSGYLAESAIVEIFDSLTARFDVSVVQTRTGSLPASLELLAPVMQGVFLVSSYPRSSAKVLAREVARAYALGLVPIGVIQTGVPSWRRTALVSTWKPDDFITMSFDEIFDETDEQNPIPESNEVIAAGQPAETSTPIDGQVGREGQESEQVRTTIDQPEEPTHPATGGEQNSSSRSTGEGEPSAVPPQAVRKPRRRPKPVPTASAVPPSLTSAIVDRPAEEQRGDRLDAQRIDVD